jgi:hypothetical protein
MATRHGSLVAVKQPVINTRFWSVAGARLVEITSVRPTVRRRRQCQVLGEQFEIL